MASCYKAVPRAASGWRYFTCESIPHWGSRANTYLAVHLYTAAIIFFSVLRRVPHSMMADDVRADFLAAHRTLTEISEMSDIARLALPMLDELKRRVEHPEPISSFMDDGGLDDLLGST